MLRSLVHLTVAALTLVVMTAEVQEGTPERMAGCFDVAVGSWTPALALGIDSLSMAPPSRVKLETTRAPAFFDPDAWRQLSVAPGALPSMHRFAGWTIEGDSIRLSWTTGFAGVGAVLAPTPEGAVGEARSFWDYTRERQTAPLRLRRVPCDSTPAVGRYDQLGLPEAIAPPGTDAVRLNETFVATDRWVAMPGFYRYHAYRYEDPGLGRILSAEVRVDERGIVRTLMLRFPTGTAFEDVEGRLRRHYDLPAGSRSQLDNAARWANRTVRMALHDPPTIMGLKEGPVLTIRPHF